MLKLTNQQGQILSIVYSAKGNLVINFYPKKGVKSINDVCYFQHELSFNSKLLENLVNECIINEQKVIEWLSNNSFNLKFTTASNDYLYFILTQKNIFIRSLTQDSKEKYTFIHPFSIPILCMISDYLSCWKTASIIYDMLNKQKQTFKQTYQNIKVSFDELNEE